MIRSPNPLSRVALLPIALLVFAKSVGAEGATLDAGVLPLDQALAMARERNPEMLMAADRIAEAEAKVGEATSAFFPQIRGRISFARTDNPAQAFGMILNQRRFRSDLDFNNPGSTQNVRPEIVGAFPLFRGGEDLARRDAARLGVDGARQQALATRNALTEAVITAYLALQVAPEQVAATAAAVEALTSAYQQTKTRLAAGSVLKADLLSLEVRLAEAREEKLQADHAVEMARAGLRTLLALDADAPVEVDREAGLPATPERDFSEIVAVATSRRPELVAAQRAVDIATREVQAQQAAYLPRIDAVGSYGNDSRDLKLAESRDNWAVGVAAEIDLFSGFRTRERVQAAERRLDQARQRARQAKLEIEHEARAATLADREARQRVEVANAAVAVAEEALRLVQLQYAAGATTITRYLEAEAASRAARTRAIAARFARQRAQAGLEKAMGTWAVAEESAE